MARRKQHQENPDDSVIVQLHPEVEEPPEPEIADDQVAEPLASDEPAEPAPDEQPEEQPRWRGPGLNRVELIGRLTADPECRVMPDGLHVTWFRMATNDRDTAEYHQLVAFEKTAKFVAEYLEVGRLVFVDGRLQTRSYTDPNGIRRRQTVIVVHRLQALDSRRPAEQ